MTSREVRSLSALAGAHAGRAALIMGGGPSLPEHVSRAPSDAVRFSANQHGCVLGAVDYVVAVDRWSKDRKLARFPDGSMRALRSLGAPVISPRREDADYLLFDFPINNSGVAAAFAAWFVGCAPVVLAGMDCYVGGTYFHDRLASSNGRNQTLKQHLHRWEKLFALVPKNIFRCLGGPLLEGVGVLAYDSKERFEARSEVPAARFVSGTRVITKRLWRMPPLEFEAGREMELGRSELSRGLRDGAVAMLKSGRTEHHG